LSAHALSRPAEYVQSRITKSNDTEIKRNELLDYIRSTDLVVITGTGVAIQTTDCPKSGDAQVAGWVGLLQHGLEYCRTHALIENDNTEIIELQLKKPTTANLIDAARQIYEWLDRKKGNARYNWLQESVGQLKVRDPALIRALAGLGGLLSTLNYDSLHTDVTGRMPLHWQQLVDVDEHVRRKSNEFIFHMHGWWKHPESIVLDHKSYYGIASNRDMRDLMRDFARFRSLLFVGCVGTFFDPNFQTLLNWANDALRQARHRHFVLCRDRDEERLHEELRDCGMLEPLAYGANFSDLTSFVEKIAQDSGKTVATANPPLATFTQPRVQKPADVWKTELK
jgi:hypothetical protein